VKVTGKDKRPKPSTHQFKKHIDEVVKPTLLERFGKHAWRMIGFLHHLEQLRYDYSANRAFQTRPVSNGALADYMGVTERTIRRWMVALEDLGIIRREHRKSRHHRYKNLLNRPKSGSIRYNEHWRHIAENNLPSGRKRPCMDMVAANFRKSLNKYAVSYSDPSITKRWTNFCKAAFEAR